MAASEVEATTEISRDLGCVTFRGQGESAAGILEALNQDQNLESDDYKKNLKALQIEFILLQRALLESKRYHIFLMEGPDAAGKGGSIKRMVEKLDPRNIRVYSIVKPTAEEYAHHYMLRFWHKLPPRGQIAIFDRSWYGRVLVERVEGFAKAEEWQRAFREITDFERTLIDDGAIFTKIYLQISKDEQLHRFKKRENDPLKHWKISDEDWRNRRRWKEHIEAAEEMFEKTATSEAPWQVMAGNSKWYSRVQTLRLAIDSLKSAGLKG